MKNKIEEQLTENQFGLRKGTSSRKTILVLRQVIENKYKKRKQR